MALFQATITEVTGSDYEMVGSGLRLLNSNRLSGLTVSGTGSFFNYTTFLLTDNENIAKIKCSDSVAEIVLVAEVALAVEMISLSVYPSNDLTQTPVATYVNVSDIVLGEKYTSYTRIEVGVIGSSKRWYVSDTLDEISDKAVAATFDSTLITFDNTNITFDNA